MEDRKTFRLEIPDDQFDRMSGKMLVEIDQMAQKAVDEGGKWRQYYHPSKMVMVLECEDWSPGKAIVLQTVVMGMDVGKLDRLNELQLRRNNGNE